MECTLSVCPICLSVKNEKLPKAQSCEKMACVTCNSQTIFDVKKSNVTDRTACDLSRNVYMLTWKQVCQVPLADIT